MSHKYFRIYQSVVWKVVRDCVLGCTVLLFNCLVEKPYFFPNSWNYPARFSVSDGSNWIVVCTSVVAADIAVFDKCGCWSLCTEWDVYGDARKISEQWLGPLITKALINARWKVNQLIDMGKRRPAEVDREQWNILVAKRKTDESKQKSEKMRSISKGKGSVASQLQTIEKDVLCELVRNVLILVHSRFIGLVVQTAVIYLWACICWRRVCWRHFSFLGHVSCFLPWNYHCLWKNVMHST